ncbi:MAG: type IV secretory system conjugative DNA transfer family protein [Candidatus Nealsonbacteria bacterium]|nr:type IV secretory system conjugative DNA transfer family protein [Candidatus Nealsonbacteria bacterium]
MEPILNFRNIAVLGGLAIIAVFSVFYIIISKRKEKAFLGRGMDLALFLVTLPQRIGKEKEEKIPLETHLKSAEQFYSSLTSVKETNFIKRIFFGNPAFVFEIAVHRTGEEIYFYIACPRYLAGVIEKQILAFWPQAQVQLAGDYNIFNPSGFSTGANAHLARSPVFPLKSYREFGMDPLSAITSVFTKLAKEGEGAAVQILVRPSRRKIKKMGQKVLSLIEKGAKPEDLVSGMKLGDLIKGTQMTYNRPQQPGQPQSNPILTPTQQEAIKSITEKISQPVFDVNLRILSSAETQMRADQILLELQAAFSQFNTMILNQTSFKKLSGSLLKKLFYRFSFRAFNDKEIMTLSSGELAAIFHFPSPQLLTPHVKWLKTKQAPSPDNLPEEGLTVGKNIFRGEEKIVRISDDDRRRHFYVIGQTGTGKSVLLQEMIKQDIEAGRGVCLIDPHGDLAERVLSYVPASRAEDVIYFNPGDIERPLGLNMLDYDPRFPETKTFVVNEIIEIFEKLYNLKAQGFGGPIFEQYMRNALLLIMDHPESGSTLVEVPKVLADPEFRKYKLSKCKNIVVKNFWEQEAEKAGGEAALANMVPYITSKMNIFIANDLVRPIISQQQPSFNMRQIMDEQKILIVNLSKGKLGDINSHLLGMIIVGKILIATFSRADLLEEERKDFYLYIDEFHNVTTQTITAALDEARKYRLSMIFGHQFIGQLEEETKKAIFGNVGSMMSFRVGPEDAKFLVAEFGPVFDEDDLVNMDNYNAAFRLLINGETSKPFNVITNPPSKGNTEITKAIKEYSRTKYGRDRIKVEEELYSRLQKSFEM